MRQKTGITVFHLQNDWQETVGQQVEVRLNGCFIESGRVCAVEGDGLTIRLNPDSGPSVSSYAKEDGFQVWRAERKGVTWDALVRALAGIGEPTFDC
ncbi:hypothetical protein KNN17_22045 [Arthrobacter bambusae]|uniref:hypothetical protein n=1 Tax=Arthrobacter bambusae TaxID=1338426 RepID=UPI001F505C85|nr:hypothetical protein [Arthrobacter bambusae]MCI0144231.1 hypothetical protein [Arthrobacter bambusae]